MPQTSDDPHFSDAQESFDDPLYGGTAQGTYSSTDPPMAAQPPGSALTPIGQPAYPQFAAPRQGTKELLGAVWRSFHLSEKAVFVFGLVVTFVAFVLFLSFTGTAVPNGGKQSLAWVARCYAEKFDPDSADPASRGPFPWDLGQPYSVITQADVDGLPSFADAENAVNIGTAAIFLATGAYLMLTVLGRCQCDGRRCCGCRGECPALMSCAALGAGTVGSILCVMVMLLTRGTVAQYHDCDGRAWNSLKSA